MNNYVELTKKYLFGYFWYKKYGVESRKTFNNFGIMHKIEW